MITNETTFYTVNDLPKILPIGRNAAYRLVNQEGFPKIKIGKKILIPAAKFYQWLDSNVNQSV